MYLKESHHAKHSYIAKLWPIFRPPSDLYIRNHTKLYSHLHNLRERGLVLHTDVHNW